MYHPYHICQCSTPPAIPETEQEQCKAGGEGRGEEEKKGDTHMITLSPFLLYGSAFI